MDFQVILDWLTTNGFEVAAQLLSFIFGLVIMIVQLKKYYIQKNQSKEEKLKYRTANYRETQASPAQKFDTEVDQYRLNKSTNELEKLPDKLDIQQVVQSAESQSLANMLQHLEPVSSDEDIFWDVHNDLLDQLDMMREADSYRLSLCEKYQLDPKLSYDKVIKYLQEQEAFQRGKIEELQKMKTEVKLNETSEVDNVKS